MTVLNWERNGVDLGAGTGRKRYGLAIATSARRRKGVGEEKSRRTIAVEWQPGIVLEIAELAASPWPQDQAGSERKEIIRGLTMKTVSG